MLNYQETKAGKSFYTIQSASKDQQSQKKLNFEFDSNKQLRMDPSARSNSLTFVNSPLKVINNKPNPTSTTIATKNNDHYKVKIEITENNSKDSGIDLKSAYKKYLLSIVQSTITFYLLEYIQFSRVSHLKKLVIRI